MNYIAIAFFVLSLVAIVFSVMDGDGAILIYGIFLLIIGFLFSWINGEKQKDEENIQALKETSGLQVVDVWDGERLEIECVTEKTKNKLKLELSYLEIKGVRQIIVPLSDTEIVTLNKDNVDEFFPSLDCLAK